MALANVAALLAKWGNKVLTLDWDIEAPGIERYFLNSPSKLANSRKETDGIVDLVLAYTQDQPLDWRQCLVKAFPFGDDAEIDIITAGRETADYNSRVRQIAWVDLFKHKEFGTYLEQLREQWITEYDFVLIDSRTGITDIGGICTIHLPDVLVLFFTANWQSVQGALDVMQRAKEKHQSLPFDRRELIGIPVPSRFENITEYERASEWKKVFSNSFADIYGAWVSAHSSVVVDRLIIPNIPYWSFSEPFPELGEPLPVTQESTSDIRSVSHAYAVLGQLIHSRLSEFARLTNSREGTTRVMVSSTISDLEKERDAVDRALRQLNLTRIGLETFGSAPRPAKVISALLAEQCDIFVLIIGERYGYMIESEKMSVVEFEYEVARAQNPEKILIYVKSGVHREPALTKFLERVQDFEHGYLTSSFTTPEELYEKIQHDITRQLTAQVQQNTQSTNEFKGANANPSNPKLKHF